MDQDPAARQAAPTTAGRGAAEPGGIGGVLATVGGNLFLIVGTIFFATLAVLVSWLPPRGRWFDLCARAWSRGLLLSAGVGLETRFAVELPADRPVVFMSNHQGLYDIPALILALPGQTRFLAKRGLFQIPLFGWALKMAGFISIDRGDRSRAADAFADAIHALQTGASAVVFPEGTRSTDGKLLPFQRGGFLLAMKAGLPIVPVGIRGSMAVRHKKGLKIRPGRIVVGCGRPIDTSEYGVRDKARLMEEVRRQVAAQASL